jgi:HK97 family phage major capsid protein
MHTIAEQLAAFEAKRAANVAAMKEVMEKAAQEGATLDESEQETFDTLTIENEKIDSHLKRLRTMEREAASKAAPAKGEKASEGTESRAALTVKAPPKLPPGIGFARLARVKALAKLDGESPRHIAKELYGETSEVYGLLTKAAVAAATTGGQTWGHQLVGDETSVFADFVEFLRPQTILGRFGSNGIPSLRRVPFRTALIGQDSGGSGYWVGEGKAKPLTSFSFTRTTLEPLKVANIAVVTEEVLRDSSPSAEMIVRDSLAAALRERLDTDFIDPAKSASAGVSPASIANGISPIPSNGGTADDVRADIQALFGAFIAANNAPTSGVWIMPATMALALSLMQNPLGQSEFPGISMNGGIFFGLPVIVSEYVPTITGGTYVMLVNASDIYMADEGGIMVDMSREASLEMATDPTMNVDSPSETTTVSLWQTNAVGFRAERTINWARRRSSAVAVLSAVTWDPGAT